MNNNLTLSVTLTGDGRQLSGTLKDARNDVREFGTTTERESRKADTALTAPGRSAVTVSEHLREAGREARTFGTETAQGGRVASQALSQTSGEAQTVTGHLDQLRTVAAGVGVALATIGARDFVMNAYAAVSSSQQLQGSLKTVTGSIENASAAWDTLLGFAAETPFTLDQSVQAFIRMQSLGLNPSLEALRSYGNTASAMGKDMMQMVEAVADATTGEFERLKEFGIRASKEGEQISFTFQGVTTTVANSAAAISQYLQQIGENQFAGAMGDQMDTLSGKASNLEDTIYQFYLAVGDAGAADIFESTLANASNTVQFLTDNIDTLATGAEVMAVLIGGRVVLAVGSATQQTIAYQLALARMAGISATAAAGQTALAAATRGASAAMALVGGPAGAALLAAGAIIYFRDELGLTQQAIGYTEEELASLRQEMADMDGVQITQTLSQVEDSLMQVGLKAAAAREELAQLRSESGGSGVLGFEGGRVGEEIRGMQAVAEYTEKMTELEQKRAVMQEELTSRTQEGTVAMDDMTVTAARLTGETELLGKATGETAEKTYTAADSYEALLDRITLNRAAARQYAQSLGVLNLALASGRINTVQYMQAMGLLQENFQAAQRETDNLAAKTVDAAFTMEGAWDEVRLNGLRRLDDGFADLWEGAIDGSLNAGELMKRGLNQTLAEMAQMAFTRPITVQFATSMGFGGSSSAGGQQPGGSTSIGGLPSFSGMMDGSGAIANAYRAFQGTGSTYAGQFGSELAVQTQGGLKAGFESFAASGVGNAALGIGGGLAGGYVGTELGSSVFGKTANSNYGAIGGAAIGQALIPIPGLGSLIGGGIGGMLDSLFGSGKKSYDYDFQQGGNFGVYGDRESAFGQFGATSFSDWGDEQRQQLDEMMNGIVELDNAIAAAALPDRFDAMAAAIEGFSYSGPEGLIEARLRAMIDNSGSAMADAVMQIADPQQLADAFVRVLQLEQIGQQLGGAVLGDIEAEINRQGTAQGVTDAANAMAVAANAAALLADSSDRLNLQFDATAAGAIHVASALQAQFGGAENLAAVQSAYYQTAFSEAERLTHQQESLNAQFAALNMSTPDSVEQIRQLVEAQDLNTDAGAQLAYELMALTPALDELTTAMARQNRAIWDNIEASLSAAYQNSLGRTATANDLYYWMTQIEAGAVSLDAALQMIANSTEAAGVAAAGGTAGIREREQLERQLLQAQRNTAALRALELAALNPANHELQRRIWAIQDEQAALQEAERQQQRYTQALASAQTQLVNFGAGVNNWLAQLQSTDAGMGTPQQQLDAADADFWAQYEKALAGDRNALQSITSYADRYLQAGQGMYASGTGAQSIRDELIDAMELLPGLLSAEEFLADEFKNTIGQQTDALASEFDMLKDSIHRDLYANFENIDINLDGLIDWSEFRRAFEGVASNEELRRIFDKLDTDGSRTISLAEAQRQLLSTMQGISANAEGSIRSLEDFFYRAGSPSWGLRVSMSHHQDEGAVRSFGWHTANEIANQATGGAYLGKFGGPTTASAARPSGSTTGSGSSGTGSSTPTDAYGNPLDSSASGPVANAYRSVLGRDPDAAGLAYWEGRYAAGLSLAEIRAALRGEIDGSHANGLWNVPFDGYVAELHRDEMVVPAQTAERLRDLPSRRTPSMGAMSLPNYPLLSSNDAMQVQRDLIRENQQLRADLIRLLNESNKHLAAANNQRGAAAKGQISAIERGNKMLKRMEDDKRLEAAKR